MITYPDLRACQICPRNCGVDRYSTKGFCGATSEMRINLAQLHFGEEPPLSGTKGSGTVFFSHCHLKCVYCQNYSISYEGFGDIYSEAEMADMMLGLQEKGAHNVNLVSPTHYTLQVREAIKQAKDQGLRIPILWNSSAYEKVETLHQLKGLVDIYMPDFKYFHSVYAKKYSFASDYPKVALVAIKEMVAQVGFLHKDSEGIATKGVIVRLLVLPNGLSGTKDTLHILADEFGNEIPISLMAQYYPAGKAKDYRELDRGITEKEYNDVLDTVMDLGFQNVFAQEISCSDEWTPRFSREKK